jgi:hypothetical protein
MVYFTMRLFALPKRYWTAVAVVLFEAARQRRQCAGLVERLSF